MIRTDREYEFAKMYFDWVCRCLEEDELYEELAYFRLGTELSIRQLELSNIKFSQVEYPYILNIKISKKNQLNTTYDPMKISKETYDAINKIDNGDRDKIFVNPPLHYINKIRMSIGDIEFNGVRIRKIGTSIPTFVSFLNQLE